MRSCCNITLKCTSIWAVHRKRKSLRWPSWWTHWISLKIFFFYVISDRGLESKNHEDDNSLQNICNVQNDWHPLRYVPFIGAKWDSKSNQFKDPSQSHCNKKFEDHIVPKKKKRLLILTYKKVFVHLNLLFYVCFLTFNLDRYRSGNSGELVAELSIMCRAMWHRTFSSGLSEVLFVFLKPLHNTWGVDKHD